VNPLLPAVLFLSGALAVTLALMVQRRPEAPGVRTFGWLCTAMAVWLVAGAFHALAATLDLKLFWARVQYVGICSVPPLWLLFAADYAGAGRILTPRSLGARRSLGGVLWILPVATMGLAATNELHHAIWTHVQIEPSGLTTYSHGWWFWFDAAYNYLLVLGGTVLVVRALRRSPPLFHGQFLAIIVAAVIPWAGNLAYIAGVLPPGLDITPLAFTLSGALFAWALYSNHLFDLIPVARDMVVDSLGDAMIVVDPSRRILDLNATAQQLVRAPRHWIGQPLEAALPLLAETKLAADAQNQETLILPGPTGLPRYYDVRVMPVRSRNRLAAWAVVLRDVSEQRRSADERDAFQARVQEQQRRESLSILAGGLAHDFNNLLAGIVGNADLLALQVPPSSEMSANVSAILLGAQRAADLVSKMLAYAGERHGSTGLVDLDELVHELLPLLRASAGRHCTIEYRGDPDVLVQGDPTQLRQVAMNLIINAAEAVEEGAGMVVVTVGSALLTTRQLQEMRIGQESAPGRYAYLEVRDNGNGMDEATLRRICQPFFTTKAAGHGLGLAAVQGIVLGHRGAMRVESQPEFGSRFCVWFPKAEAAAATASFARAAAS
jgi:signal transduction histidine kinase